MHYTQLRHAEQISIQSAIKNWHKVPEAGYTGIPYYTTHRDNTIMALWLSVT